MKSGAALQMSDILRVESAAIFRKLLLIDLPIVGKALLRLGYLWLIELPVTLFKIGAANVAHKLLPTIYWALYKTGFKNWPTYKTTSLQKFLLWFEGFLTNLLPWKWTGLSGVSQDRRLATRVPYGTIQVPSGSQEESFWNFLDLATYEHNFLRQYCRFMAIYGVIVMLVAKFKILNYLPYSAKLAIVNRWYNFPAPVRVVNPLMVAVPQQPPLVGIADRYESNRLITQLVPIPRLAMFPASEFTFIAGLVPFIEDEVTGVRFVVVPSAAPPALLPASFVNELARYWTHQRVTTETLAICAKQANHLFSNIASIGQGHALVASDVALDAAILSASAAVALRFTTDPLLQQHIVDLCFKDIHKICITFGAGLLVPQILYSWIFR